MGRSARSVSVSLLDRLGDTLNAHLALTLRRLGDCESRALRATLADVHIDRPVYICGVARAGTTLLLEAIASAPGFTSHRYADYPFLWTPYWWNHLRSRLPLPPSAPVERAHRDRIEVTFESPEAFEEVLWMHFFAQRHDAKVNQVLDATASNPAFDAFYPAHVRKLLAVRGATRYVAKANYNLLRIAYLARLFADARFVIAVREPVAHVASLIKQDRLFSELAQRDPRSARHLHACGHFEFGIGKRALNCADTPAAQAIARCFAEGRAVEGYARQWASAYGWLARTLRDEPRLAQACLLVDYNTLCADPTRGLTRVFDHVEVDSGSARVLLDRLAGRISQPDYYVANLTDDDRASIERLTADAWQSIRGGNC